VDSGAKPVFSERKSLADVTCCEWLIGHQHRMNRRAIGMKSMSA
jgi:hypothetical protein